GPKVGWRIVHITATRWIRRFPSCRVIQDCENIDPDRSGGRHEFIRSPPVKDALLRLNRLPVKILADPSDATARKRGKCTLDRRGVRAPEQMTANPHSTGEIVR